MVRSSIFRKAVAGTVTSHPPRFRARNTSNGVQFTPSTNAFQGVPKSCSTTSSRPPSMITCKPTCIASGGPKVDRPNPANRRSNICTGRISQAPMTLRLSLWNIIPFSSRTRPGGRPRSTRADTPTLCFCSLKFPKSAAAIFCLFPADRRPPFSIINATRRD
jgi:hypothetical protein